jgi:heat shock protein HslJ
MEQPNGETIQIPNPKDYTVRFDSEEVVNIKADCNLCSGNYNVNGSSLTLDPVMACTMAMCLPGSHSDAYIAAMGEATSYTRDGSGLDVRYRDSGLLRFRAGN